MCNKLVLNIMYIIWLRVNYTVLNIGAYFLSSCLPFVYLPVGNFLAQIYTYVFVSLHLLIILLGNVET